MSSERRPGVAYPQQQIGPHPGQFDVEAQVWHEGPKEIVRYVENVGTSQIGTATVEAFKPDARILLTLTIGFLPDRDCNLDTNIGPGTLRAGLVRTVVWLAGCRDVGGVLREVENLVGTETVPAQMIQDGLWGVMYEVDVDVKAVRARIDFESPNMGGRFLAAAKWVAIAPISDRDWFRARERMQLLVRPKPRAIDFAVGG